MVGLPRDALLALRTSLFRELGGNAATHLHGAGYAGGQALYEAFARWCRARNVGVPDDLTTAGFEARLSEFLTQLGLGGLHVGTLGDSVLTLDSANWAESDAAQAMQFPGCYLTAGMLTELLGRIAGAPLMIMEVECRSMGSPRCRFLAGSPETIQQVYEGMTQGTGYEAVLQQLA
jgi:predicted hydrocarbon binding protein